MKRTHKGILSCVVSLILTFLVFHFCSWYNFGDIPTPLVAIRLVIFWLMLSIIVFEIFLFFSKNKKEP